MARDKPRGKEGGGEWRVARVKPRGKEGGGEWRWLGSSHVARREVVSGGWLLGSSEQEDEEVGGDARRGCEEGRRRILRSSDRAGYTYYTHCISS